MINSITKLYERDLLKLKQEIELYGNEADLWKIQGGIANSAGNLALHLIGSLNHFLGNHLGGIDYVRNRPLEFSDKNVPKIEIVAKIEATRQMLNEVLPKISGEVLAQKQTDGENSNEYFVIQLYGHFNYHLGQINYHRRLLTNRNNGTETATSAI
ncbi:DinB superfamily protein [Mucilaginibacter sp. McL0603]|uniref:DinB superfamily protein n=1 Tax=Mucilaginibacter sp. McL0603 TaxID=3415670 RepID=UPI003CF03428